jgi:hypothetical protein
MIEQVRLSDLVGISEGIQPLLDSFTNNGLDHDVELFIRQKAITFEKCGLSRTTLVFDGDKFAGYFTIAVKQLEIAAGVWNSLSHAKQRAFMPLMSLKRITPPVHPPSHLIAELGRNFACKSSLSGSDLLRMAEQRIYEAYSLSGGRFLWLETHDIPKVMTFYCALNHYGKLFTRDDGTVILVKPMEQVSSTSD